MAAHVHRVLLEDILFQRTPETATLLRKADRAARLILGREVHAGEIFRVIEPGVYHLLFPNLTPKAGLERAAALKAKLHQELRHLDPNSKRVIETRADLPPQPAALSPPNPHLQPWTPPRLEFHAVWNIQTNMITGYRCVLGADTAAHMDGTHRDLETYAQAVQAVHTLLQRGLKALLIVPLSFTTITHPRFINAFIAIGGNMSDDARALIVFEIVGVPAGLSRIPLRDPIAHLRGRSRALVALTGLETGDFELYRQLGFHSVGFDLGLSPLREEIMLPVLEKFVVTAQSHRLHAFVHGVAAPRWAVAAISAGFTYIDGSAISGPADMPASIHEFAVEYLYGVPKGDFVWRGSANGQVH